MLDQQIDMKSQNNFSLLTSDFDNSDNSSKNDISHNPFEGHFFTWSAKKKPPRKLINRFLDSLSDDEKRINKTNTLFKGINNLFSWDMFCMQIPKVHKSLDQVFNDKFWSWLIRQKEILISCSNENRYLLNWKK